MSNPFLKSTDYLAGKYVHLYKTQEGCGCRYIDRQLKVIGNVHGDIYLVQFYEWIMGDEIHQRLMSLSDLMDSRMYDDHESWIENSKSSPKPCTHDQDRSELLSALAKIDSITGDDLDVYFYKGDWVAVHTPDQGPETTYVKSNGRDGIVKLVDGESGVQL